MKGEKQNMNKFITKIAKALLGLSMAIGVGVAVGINREVAPAQAAEDDTHDFSQSLSQLLNNNASIPGITIAEQSYTVKSIVVSWRYNKSIQNAVTIEASVGGTSFGTYSVNSNTGQNYTTCTLSGTATKGEVVLSFTNNTGSGTGHGTFYVNNVQLVEGAGGTSSYKITNSIDHSTLSSSADIQKHAAVDLTITSDSHWNLPSSISVTMGGNNFTSFTYTRASGNKSATFQIAANIVEGALVLSGTSTEDSKVTVSFMDGSTTLSTVQVYQGEKVTKPSDPTKTGYTFVDWYADSGFNTAFDFANTNIQTNTSIYAKFEEKTSYDFDLSEMDNFANWGTSYGTDRSSDYDLPDGETATVTIVSAVKQTSTITDIPVSKGGAVTFVISEDSDLTIKNATFNARQWGTKAQTMTLHYSKDNGETYTSTGITSSNFVISKTGFDPGVNAIKVTFSSTSNQVGYESFEIEFYPVSSDPTVVIDNTANELSISEKENVAVEKTLTLTNVTMTELSCDYDNTKLGVEKDNNNKKITITGTVVGGPYNIDIKKGSDTLYTIHFTVTVNNTVTVTGGNSVQEGQTLQLSASSSKGNDTFTWGTSNAEVATVSAGGLVTGVAVGEVTITATSVNWSTTSGTIVINVTFGGSYSRANWYNPETLDQSNTGTDATGDSIKTAFSGNSITIASASVSNAVKDGKYGGLSFGSGSKAGSITINMNSGYYLKSVTLWGAVVDSGITPTISGSSAATLMSNRGHMMNRSQAMGDLPLTWTFASDSTYVTFSATTSTRFTIYQLDLVFTEITPTSLSLGDDASATLMSTETKTLVPSVLPRNYNVNLGFTWTTGNAEVATVSDGVVTAVGTGTTNITGSSTYGNVICSVTVIPLTASSINIRGENISTLAGTGTETLEFSGKTWDFNKTRQQSLDMTSSNTITGYTKYSVKIGDSANSGGSIGNQDAYPFKFKQVIIAYCLDGDQESPYLGGSQTITVSGSDTYGSSDYSSTTGTRVGLIETFTLSTACTYISVSTAGNRFVSSVTFVFDNAQETEFSAAEYILGLSPDRGNEVIGSCNLASGTYIAAKRFLNAAGSTVINNFRTSSDATVVRARERYAIWAANNGDSGGLYDGTENFTPTRFGLLPININNTNTVAIIVIISMVSVTAIGGYFFLRRRKENI